MLHRNFLAFLSPIVALALFSVMNGRVLAQDEFEPAPPPKKKDGVQITFLPPPMQGVISLGIYDGTGRLVRVLHKDATEKNFVVGLNGFITRWDGKDDKGEVLPPGKYAARGWMTGDLGVDGVAFHGNDWVKEDGPRFVEALRFKRSHDFEDRLTIGAKGHWQVILRSLDGQEHRVAVGEEEPELAAEHTLGRRFPAEVPEGHKIIKWTIGFGGKLWAIGETPTGREVQCYSQEGEFLRRLAYRADEPAPFDIAASTASETVLLLEKNEREQRFRILGQPETTVEGSAWKTIEQKRIVASDTFDAVARELGRPEVPKAEAPIKLTSKRNPLLQDARLDVEVHAAVSPEGVVLSTADGLPLAQVTDAKGLKWCALVREGKALTLFQSDGAVVEEFKIARPENLMSFDAGEYTLKK